jgi:hypothetical protein
MQSLRTQGGFDKGETISRIDIGMRIGSNFNKLILSVHWWRSLTSAPPHILWRCIVALETGVNNIPGRVFSAQAWAEQLDYTFLSCTVIRKLIWY